MSIKDKIKSLLNDITKSKSNGKSRKSKADSELSADEVAREQVYPKKTVCNKKARGTKKPASKRTRPTNHNYEMIDTDDNTCDSSKS